jgi:2-oxo-hept-3-ene-1,7-dioate hydratase
MNEELTAAQHQQLANLADLERQGEKVGGWKLGLTSGEARDAFGPGIRPFGFILASRILQNGEQLQWLKVGTGGIENEVCFLIGEDVRAPVTPESVRGHLAGIAPGFEINQRRIPASSPPTERVADDLSNWGIVVGPMHPIDEVTDLAHLTVTLSREGQIVAAVHSEGHIDDHFSSLATLANQLLAFDRRLQRGDHVITGAFGRAPQPDPGNWSGDFGADLGAVSVIIV